MQLYVHVRNTSWGSFVRMKVEIDLGIRARNISERACAYCGPNFGNFFYSFMLQKLIFTCYRLAYFLGLDQARQNLPGRDTIIRIPDIRCICIWWTIKREKKYEKIICSFELMRVYHTKNVWFLNMKYTYWEINLIRKSCLKFLCRLFDAHFSWIHSKLTKFDLFMRCTWFKFGL